MGKAVKLIYVIEMENGETHVVSTDKRQMARWYAMDYLRDKPRLTDKGYTGVVSEDFSFSPTFRRRR